MNLALCEFFDKKISLDFQWSRQGHKSINFPKSLYMKKGPL